MFIGEIIKYSYLTKGIVFILFPSRSLSCTSLKATDNNCANVHYVYSEKVNKNGTNESHSLSITLALVRRIISLSVTSGRSSLRVNGKGQGVR